MRFYTILTIDLQLNIRELGGDDAIFHVEVGIESGRLSDYLGPAKILFVQGSLQNHPSERVLQLVPFDV